MTVTGRAGVDLPYCSQRVIHSDIDFALRDGR
jgi:hypothetical protein